MLERNIHSSLNHITGASPDRKNQNVFDVWAGALTAAVHTTSVVRSAPAVAEHYGLTENPVETTMRMRNAFGRLVMEHQDRLGDIKVGLSGVDENGYPLTGSTPIAPNLLELQSNGLIVFKANVLNDLPIADFRKNSPIVNQLERPLVPNQGEQFVGDIEPRTDHIGCPISFINGFSEGLLRAVAESAHDNRLI